MQDGAVIDHRKFPNAFGRIPGLFQNDFAEQFRRPAFLELIIGGPDPAFGICIGPSRAHHFQPGDDIGDKNGGRETGVALHQVVGIAGETVILISRGRASVNVEFQMRKDVAVTI